MTFESKMVVVTCTNCKGVIETDWIESPNDSLALSDFTCPKCDRITINKEV